jgi:dihydroorotate dehydrogenase electron transfer subunit
MSTAVQPADHQAPEVRSRAIDPRNPSLRLAALLDPGSVELITTDDGSTGQRGVVTDAMPALMAQARSEVVYACGPMPMLVAVSRIAAAAGVECQVSVEELMACGTGICYSCVIPMQNGGQGSHMARSCVDGPVLDGAAIAWEEVAVS